MRILHVIPCLMKGGAERLTLDICIELQKRKGVEVALAVLKNNDEYKSISSETNIILTPSYIIPSVTGKWKVNINAYEKFVDEYKPDIIHSHLFEAEVVTRYNVRKGVKYVTHLHDNMSQMKNLFPIKKFSKKTFTDFYEKQYLVGRYKKCNNNFIAISEDTHNYFSNVLPKLLNKINILNNAINYNKFYYSEEKKCSQTTINLVCVGSLVEKKNQIFLVDIAVSLQNKGIDFVIHVLGDGPNRDKINKAIIARGFEKNILLHGNVDAVQDYLNMADIYVHVATYEPFGLVILEAMAAGLPVVALDGKGNRDIMIDGFNGFMITEQNADLFAEKIIELQTDSNKYKTISKNAKHFSEKYNIVNYTTQLLNYYKIIN